MITDPLAYIEKCRGGVILPPQQLSCISEDSANYK